MIPSGVQALNGNDLLAFDVLHGGHAGARRLTADMDPARNFGAKLL